MLTDFDQPDIDCDVEEYLNHFKCSLCERVVLDPIECKACSDIWCSSCLQKHKNQMPGKCPNNGVNSCDGRFVTKDIHKTIEKVLHSKKFYCKNEFCPHRKYDYFNNKY